jgi:Type I restriction enzyme R protein N terminus (HSDR_N)
VRRFAKPLADLVARDANEGDTRLLVTDFLCEGLGYDKYEHLTTEYQVKGEFADYGVRIDKQLVAFIEVKRCATKLGAKQLRQVEMYAVNEGVEWMVLTNGQVWQVWHLTAGLPVVLDLALEVDLLGEGGPAQKGRHAVLSHQGRVQTPTDRRAVAGQGRDGSSVSSDRNHR